MEDPLRSQLYQQSLQGLSLVKNCFSTINIIRCDSAEVFVRRWNFAALTRTIELVVSCYVDDEREKHEKQGGEKDANRVWENTKGDKAS